MEPQAKELSVLVRHVPRIVVSRFIKKPERLRGPESICFTGVVALFDISGFSLLGSKLSDDERYQISNSKTGSMARFASGPKANIVSRSSLPVGLVGKTAEESDGPRRNSLRSSEGSAGEEADNANLVVPRDLMVQRRQSANLMLANESIGQRAVSFIGRSKPAAPQGVAVETLTKTLNKTLEPVIDVILQHGGDIIKVMDDLAHLARWTL